MDQGDKVTQLKGNKMVEAVGALVRQKDGEEVLLLILFLMLMFAFQFIISEAKCIYRNIGFQIMKKSFCTSAIRNIGKNLN